jgi:hypothetical protein
VDFAIKTVANSLEFTAAFESGDMLSAAGHSVDELGELSKLFSTNDLNGQAAELEAEAKAIELQNAEQRYKNAGKHLKRVAKRVAKAEALAKRIKERYEQFDKKAKNQYDGTAPENLFRFENLDKAIKWADQTYERAKTTFEKSALARTTILQLEQFGSSDNQWNPPDPAGAKRVIEGLDEDTGATQRLAKERAEEARTLKEKLQDTLAAAQNALVESQGTGPPRAGK